jgi:signal transduction histidine kinase
LATLMPAKGGKLPVAVSTGALRGPGNDVVGRVLVLRDLRREHEVERMKSEFLSRVGHELRTPLTGIMGYVDILRRRAVEPDQAHLWHEEILVAAKRLLRIVEILEFLASSGAGRVPLYLEPIDVSGLVEGAVTNWSGRLPVNCSLSRRVDRSTPDVLGDRRWLALALDELIDNAVKFSPDGGVITVTAAPTALAATAGANGADNGGVDGVAISVVDEGQGMTPAERATMFGEFVQGDASDTRRFGGLGLGLSLVERVVADHSGTVTGAASPRGSGSVFTMTLPAVARGTAAATDRSTTIGTGGGQG